MVCIWSPNDLVETIAVCCRVNRQWVVGNRRVHRAPLAIRLTGIPRGTNVGARFLQHRNGVDRGDERAEEQAVDGTEALDPGGVGN